MQKTLKKYWPVFIVPTLIAFAIAFILPFVIGIYLTFCKFTTITDATFTGLQNYKTAFSAGQNFLYSFGFTGLLQCTGTKRIPFYDERHICHGQSGSGQKIRERSR